MVLERWTFAGRSLFTGRQLRKHHDPTKISHLPRSARAQNKKRSHPMPANRQDLCLPRIEGLDDFIIIGHGINRLLIHFLNRSEEHTSELQSLAYLVCRLLLEKKKQ